MDLDFQTWNNSKSTSRTFRPGKKPKSIFRTFGSGHLNTLSLFQRLLEMRNRKSTFKSFGIKLSSLFSGLLNLQKIRSRFSGQFDLDFQTWLNSKSIIKTFGLGKNPVFFYDLCTWTFELGKNYTVSQFLGSLELDFQT